VRPDVDGAAHGVDVLAGGGLHDEPHASQFRVRPCEIRPVQS
jgi:hypothetical protein